MPLGSCVFRVTGHSGNTAAMAFASQKGVCHRSTHDSCCSRRRLICRKCHTSGPYAGTTLRCWKCSPLQSLPVLYGRMVYQTKGTCIQHILGGDGLLWRRHANSDGMGSQYIRLSDDAESLGSFHCKQCAGTPCSALLSCCHRPFQPPLISRQALTLSFLVYVLRPRQALPTHSVAKPINHDFLRSALFWAFQFGNILEGLGYFIPQVYLISMLFRGAGVLSSLAR